jgi:NADPH:quinone reductase-like Zn-dependent oxidoreductase
MKAIVIRGYGGPEVLRYEDYPDPIPGAHAAAEKGSAGKILLLM